MVCAQSHQNNISRLNLLYVCIPQELYQNYNITNKVYPTDPPNPVSVPILSTAYDPAEHCNVRATWEYNNKIHKDMRTMNTALVDRFLALIADPYKAKFNLVRYSTPHMKFKDAFQYSLTTLELRQSMIEDGGST